MGKFTVCCAVLVIFTTVVSASYPWYGSWNDDGWGSDDGYYPGGFMMSGMNMQGMVPWMGGNMGYGGYNWPMPYGRWGCGGWWGGDDYCGFDG